MDEDSNIPEALVRLDSDGTYWQWVTLSCPFCGGRHKHGAGQLNANPRKRLDVRVAHCKMNPDVVYQLVETCTLMMGHKCATLDL